MELISQFMNGKKTFTGIGLMAIAAATGYDIVQIEALTAEIQKIMTAIGAIIAIYGYTAKGKKPEGAAPVPEKSGVSLGHLVPAGIKRSIVEAVVHCAATRPRWMSGNSVREQLEEIRRWHMSSASGRKPWSDIGYHYFIGRNGEILIGRPLSRTPASVRGHNTGTVAICLAGGHGSSENDSFAENFTPEQDVSLRSLLALLEARYPIQKVSGHNEYAAKACPGFSVSKWRAA